MLHVCSFSVHYMSHSLAHDPLLDLSCHHPLSAEIPIRESAAFRMRSAASDATLIVEALIGVPRATWDTPSLSEELDFGTAGVAVVVVALWVLPYLSFVSSCLSVDLSLYSFFLSSFSFLSLTMYASRS